jgi:type IV secretion system protein VirB5
VKLRGKIPQLYASDGELDTPFKRARAEWDHRIGSSVVQARNWRLGALLAVIGWLCSTGGLVVLAQRPPTLRVHTIDKDGQPVRQDAAVAAADFKATDRQIAHYLREWIFAARRVSSDAGVTKRGWELGYSRTVGAAYAELYAFLKPFGRADKRSREVIVTVDEVAVTKVTDLTFQADWAEKVWTARASKPVESTYRGLHRIQLGTPKADDVDNAIGFHIREFHWNKLK